MTTTPTDPDPRTPADADDDDATDQGISTPAPAEGADDAAPKQPGSPRS